MTTLFVILFVLLAIPAVSLILVLKWIITAPRGYEDDEGFHYGDK